MALYPTLPTEEEMNVDPSTFRMGRIIDIQTLLQDENKNRITISKKYKRTANIIEGANTFFATGSVISGVGSVAITTTVVGTPIAIGLGIAAATSGLLCMIGRKIVYHLETKGKKHDRIAVYAQAKTNSIDLLISEAIRDNEISDAEFKTVCDEWDRYQVLKDEIRTKCKKSPNLLSNAQVEKLITDGRADERKKVLRQLSN